MVASMIQNLILDKVDAYHAHNLFLCAGLSILLVVKQNWQAPFGLISLHYVY